MILAIAAGRRDGADTDALVIGLSDENLHRLREGFPITIDGRTVNMPTRDLILLYGLDEAHIQQAIEHDAAKAGLDVTKEPIPVAERDRGELLHFVLTGAQRLGLVVSDPDGTFPPGTF